MCPGGSVPALMLSRSRISHGGGGSLAVGSGGFQLTINCKREGRVRLHNNQPDDDDDDDNDKDKDKNEDEDEEDDGQKIRQRRSQRPQFLTQQPTF